MGVYGRRDDGGDQGRRDYLVPGGNFTVFKKTLLHSGGETVEKQVRHHDDLPCGRKSRGFERTGTDEATTNGAK